MTDKTNQEIGVIIIVFVIVFVIISCISYYVYNYCKKRRQNQIISEGNIEEITMITPI